MKPVLFATIIIGSAAFACVANAGGAGGSVGIGFTLAPGQSNTSPGKVFNTVTQRRRCRPDSSIFKIKLLTQRPLSSLARPSPTSVGQKNNWRLIGSERLGGHQRGRLSSAR